MPVTDATSSAPVVADGGRRWRDDGDPGGVDDPAIPTATDDRPAAGSAWPVGRALLVVVLAAAVAFGGGYLVGRPDRPSANSVDVGFVQDMIDHHDNGVLMAEAVVQAPDVDPTVRAFAREVVRWQRWEVGIMDAWLRDWGHERGDPDRTAMSWMGMPVPVDRMPGLQDEAALDRLRSATGRDADRLFLTMMREHHQAGVHMSEHAARHAGEAKVRELAELMATNQAGEIREYDLALDRLGLSG